MIAVPSAELATSRILPHSPEAVFAALADPARLARWWGPAGATNVFDRFELRPGGKWIFTMRMPDGATYPMDHSFVEVRPPRRLVVAHHQAGHDFTLALDLEDAPEGTRLTWRMRFADPAQLAPIREFLVSANEQNLDRLAAELDG